MKKILSLMCLIMIIFSTLAPNLGILVSNVYSASAIVTYNGQSFYGESIVGDFTINGARAYCMEHKKTTPPSNTAVSSSIYENENIAKCLYYGYEGVEQWNGFKSKNMGIVITSLALDYFNCGTKHNIANEFINYVNSKELPKKYLNFSNSNLVAYVEGDKQRTEEITLEGDNKYSISIALQDGVTLHNVTKGSTATGNVTINGGDKFYFSAPINGKVTGPWKSSNINNTCYKYSSIVWKSTYESYQKLVQKGDYITDSSKTTNISIQWLSLGGLTIEKKNDNGDILSGVTFKIWNDSGYETTAKTNEEGKIVLDNLTPTTYYIQEQSTIDGYVLDNSIYQVVVRAGVDSSSNIKTIKNDEPTGKLTITKEDVTTKNIPSIDGTYLHGDATIDGTVYTLYANEKITNKAGTITYFNYGDELATFTFNEKGIATVKITNYDTSANLKINGSTLEGIPIGKYILKETTVPRGYNEDKTVYEYNFRYKDMNTKLIEKTGTVYNEIKREPFEIIKISSNDNGTAELIKDAEFTAILKRYVDFYGGFDEALKHTGEYRNDEWCVMTTDEKGYAISKRLAYGTYVVSETYLPNDNMDKVKDFNVTLSNESETPTQHWKVENDTPFSSYLKMKKIDADTGKSVVYSNATFELYKFNDENQNWEQVKCKVGKDYFNKWTTDKDGIAYTQTKLDYGTYKLTEIVTPQGYNELDNDIIFDISASNSTCEYDSDMDAWITVVAKNEQPTGKLQLNKKINLKEDVDKTMIKDIDFTKISFELVADDTIIDYADGSTIYEKGTVVGQHNLNADGTLTITDLPLGKYHLKELTTIDGAVLDETEHKVEFTQTDTTTKEYVVELNIENDTTLIEISKKAITGEDELVGATLKVIDENNEVIDSWVSTNKPHIIEGLAVDKEFTLVEEISIEGYVKATEVKFRIKNNSEIQKVVMIDKVLEILKVDNEGKPIKGVKLQVLNKDGEIIDSWITDGNAHKVSGLTEGESYVLHEEIAVEGFVKAKDIKFTVNYDKQTQYITMIDKTVEVSKTDLTTGEELEGAELQIVDEDGNIIDSWTSCKDSHIVKGLEEGKKYILKETNAPYGYELAEEIEFVVSENKETQKVEMKDMPILKNVKVIKIDSDTKERIKDKFTFGIYEDEECTKLIKEVDSNIEDGTALFDGLRYGTYYLKELNAPKGYELSTKVVKVEINDRGIFVDGIQIEENDDTVEFTYENKKIEIPKTGDDGNIMLIGGIGLLSILSLVYIVIHNHNKRKEE